MSKLVNKVISDAVEIDNTSSQWIKKLGTFFSLPENITRWQNILSAYASTTSEFNDLKSILPSPEFDKIMESQENVRNKYYFIQAWIGYLDPNDVQCSEFKNTYNDWAKNRVTPKRLKIIRENMKIIEDDYKDLCDIFTVNINNVDRRREDLLNEVEEIIEYNRNNQLDDEEKMMKLNHSAERLSSFQYLLMEDLKNTISGLVEHLNARHIWAQFLMEKIKTLKQKEVKKRSSFSSFLLCSNENRE